MTNKAIAKTFQELADIMELHGENPFKIRSYQNAYITLRKLDQPLADMTVEELDGIKGVGTAIAGKIRELLETGHMATLEQYKEKTPEGVQEMLHIAGFGPKKVLTVWKDLGVETVGELLYAVNENRLIELKGFGKKTQDDLKQKLEYYQRSKNSFHYATLEAAANSLLEKLQANLPDTKISLCGDIRRCANTLTQIEVLIGAELEPAAVLTAGGLQAAPSAEKGIAALTEDEYPVLIHQCAPEDFGSKLFLLSGASVFIDAFVQAYPGVDFKHLHDESQVFEKAGIPFVAPELRDSGAVVAKARQGALPELITEKDIKGVVHAHSTYSDGLHSLRDMAVYARSQGFGYLAMTDHSKSAFYANGLQPERVLAQMDEIDALNAELAPFKIFKGIESDILNDGSLDYEDDILAKFDFIIASIHSNLRMDEAKATQRLITAVENPYTTILGHPTGRLLLSRQGYPIDHQKVIDACAANGVAIEINANPYRLDLDWTWIGYALEKGVWISVNPDAHSREGMHDIHFGVLSARKGGLTAAQCLNALDSEGFGRFCAKKRN